MKIAERWRRLNAEVIEAGAADERVRERYRTLDTLYTEVGRSYHTWRHVAECIDWLDRYARAHPPVRQGRRRLESAARENIAGVLDRFYSDSSRGYT